MIRLGKSLVLVSMISLIGGLSLTGCDFLGNLLNDTADSQTLDQEKEETNNNSATLLKLELSGSYRSVYRVGDEFNPRGMLITAHYSDGSRKDVTKNCTFEGFDSTEEKEINVLIKYGEQSVTIRLKIIERYIYFGSYPQSVVTDESLITSLEALTTYNSQHYYEYGGEKYEKLTAKPCYSGETFNNGELIEYGKNYYFKVEPIQWRCLSKDEDSALLTSEFILDTYQYASFKNETYSNNYKDSDIRNWLYSKFYQKAISDKSVVESTLVDNSVESTFDLYNPYVCEDTKDTIFLLSRNELLNADYGFPPSLNDSGDERICITTEYARAKGAKCSYNKETPHNGWYWTRSPYYDRDSEDADCVYVVNDEGYVLGREFVDSPDFGVRPCLSLKI